MSGKNIGLALSAVGLLIGLASVFAESIGLADYSGFGYRQWTGTILGALVLLSGLVVYAKAPKTT